MNEPLKVKEWLQYKAKIHQYINSLFTKKGENGKWVKYTEEEIFEFFERTANDNMKQRMIKYIKGIE